MRAETETAIALVDAPTLVGRFHRAGVLGLADVHTALGLGRIGGEDRDPVLLAVALTVRALRGGSVCVDLRTVAETVFEAAEEAVESQDLPWPDPEPWIAAVRDSPLVTDGSGTGTDAAGGRPLRLDRSTLYLERYWAEEDVVREQLRSRLGEVPLVDHDRLRAGLDRVFDPADLAEGEADRQRIAAAAAVLGRITVVAGGPGTGKTTTVAKLLALLADQPGRRRVALAAPTGKAAARLGEAVTEATAQLPAEDAARVGTVTASTLHRLLGTRWDRPGRFVHGRDHHLPYEVIVVDEMSMVSLPMMARLLEAVRPDARLILVGDPDQLTSVEAGAVMADIVQALPGVGAELTGPAQQQLAELADDGRGITLPTDIRSGVVRLTHTWRFTGAISQLATAIREGDADRACEIVAAGHDDLEFIATDPEDLRIDHLDRVRHRTQQAATAMVEAAIAGDAEAAVSALDRHRVLCGHRSGPFGVRRWTREIERWWHQAGLAIAGPADEPWYVGRPVLVTANNYELGLFNGDTGVVVDTADGLRAVFSRDGGHLSHAPARLEQVQTVHAMTVHQGQGSQFTEVSFVVPPQDSPLLTRELVYTAVTRATDRVTIVGSLESLHRAVLRPANRASGLRQRL
ncbi:MAG TPA: exodeoxyribonuclease V subunit alpha [Candidatus Avipropionibacterium avicola]|uniref:RecBCD enzyme subunit RecD n=1 Tax=Candidatus Avipropionibacterium avicola TaxID=2840701 RepID=A0A9D1GZY4_9ACTN|nr:exodeoxyribonuclease V subunit alpha [Candidatus Avipropionibacterium avicola]